MPRFERGFLFVLGLALGIGVGAWLVSIEIPGVVWPAPPAWLQVLAPLMTSLIAAAIAIYIPTQLHHDKVRRDDAERAMRGASLAIQLLPGIGQARIAATGHKKAIETALEWEAAGREVDHEWAVKFETRGVIPLPSDIGTAIKDVYLLGSPAGESVQSAISLSGAYNREIMRQHEMRLGLAFNVLAVYINGAEGALVAAEQFLLRYLKDRSEATRRQAKGPRPEHHSNRG